MRDSIGIKVTGSGGVVYLPDFLKAGNDLAELLTEVDLSISPNHIPTVDWRLKKLSYSSPAIMLAEPVVKEEQPDNRITIIDTVLVGIQSLKATSDRPRGFSDKALEKARELAIITSNGIERIDIISDDTELEFTWNIADNITTILKPGREIFGSIEGRLETLNSHGGFKFAIFEPILVRRIRCELMNKDDVGLKKRVIALYEHNVLVTGLLSTNIRGEVQSAKVDNILDRELVQIFKDASEVTAIYDLTGGVDPVEHIRRIRDDG
jgi:hypothetical protein